MRISFGARDESLIVSLSLSPHIRVGAYIAIAFFCSYITLSSIFSCYSFSWIFYVMSRSANDSCGNFAVPSLEVEKSPHAADVNDVSVTRATDFEIDR